MKLPPLAPATAETAKKSLIILKEAGSTQQMKSTALEILNRYLTQQPHVGERYRIRNDELSGNCLLGSFLFLDWVFI